MEFLPRTSGARPRLACELRSEGIVAARAEDASDLLAAVSRSTFGSSALPLVRVGELPGSHTFGPERSALVAALRKALEAVLQRSRDLTLIVPDGAARVLLLDFDALPAKPAEALSVVRFRLKKLVPFEVEHAAVSYQVMASSRDSIQVLAVAMPGDLRAEYESLVRDAGFEPGAVLPSTLAAIAGLREDRPALLVNASHDGVTTAIVRAGSLLLHRTVDLSASAVSSPEPAPKPSSTAHAPGDPSFASPPSAAETSISAIAARLAAGRAAVVTEPPAVPAPDPGPTEVAQAVSVAMAYFEDTLEAHPSVIFSAGTLGAPALTSILDSADIRPVAVQELVDRNMLGVGASTGASAIPLGWLAGVRGALAL